MPTPVRQSASPDDVPFRRVGQLLNTELPRLEAATSRGEFKVWGEVIELHRYPTSTRCQIRDKDQLVSLQTKLPAKVEVQIGDYILVHGSLSTMTKKSTGTATLIVEGSIAKNYSSKRLTALEATIAQLKDTHATSPLPSEAFGRVGIVTGRQSKALHDFRSTLKKCTSSEVFLTSLSSPRELAKSIDKAASSDIGLLVVTRGGGDIMDLAPFDEPEVLTALAIACSQIPVILAIGHATDHLRASQFASHTCPTPSTAGWTVRKLFYDNRRRAVKTKQPRQTVAAMRSRLSTWKRPALTLLLGGALGWAGSHFS